MLLLRCSFDLCHWSGLDNSSYSRHKKRVHGVIPARRCRKTEMRCKRRQEADDVKQMLTDVHQQGPFTPAADGRQQQLLMQMSTAETFTISTVSMSELTEFSSQ